MTLGQESGYDTPILWDFPWGDIVTHRKILIMVDNHKDIPSTAIMLLEKIRHFLGVFV